MPCVFYAPHCKYIAVTRLYMYVCRCNDPDIIKLRNITECCVMQAVSGHVTPNK